MTAGESVSDVLDAVERQNPTTICWRMRVWGVDTDLVASCYVANSPRRVPDNVLDIVDGFLRMHDNLMRLMRFDPAFAEEHMKILGNMCLNELARDAQPNTGV